MRPISTRFHGVMDYLMGLLFIAAPWLFGFADHNGLSNWAPIAAGMAMIVYSLLTRYELGMLPVISPATHVWLDIVAGVFLAVSPWIFGFAAVVWAPHLWLGLLAIGGALLTKREPQPIDVLGTPLMR